jgi:hypothetical protein
MIATFGGKWDILPPYLTSLPPKVPGVFEATIVYPENPIFIPH